MLCYGLKLILLESCLTWRCAEAKALVQGLKMCKQQGVNIVDVEKKVGSTWKIQYEIREQFGSEIEGANITESELQRNVAIGYATPKYLFLY